MCIYVLLRLEWICEVLRAMSEMAQAPSESDCKLCPFISHIPCGSALPRTDRWSASDRPHQMVPYKEIQHEQYINFIIVMSKQVK
jgi:hypothetical protein